MGKYLLLGVWMTVWGGTNVLDAQTLQVKGTVRHALTELPLPGVWVSIEGDTTGVFTGADGIFSLQVENRSQPMSLSFSREGFLTRQVAVSQRPDTTMEVVLEPVGYIAGDVVITAQKGLAQQSRDLTVSMITVSAPQIRNQAFASAASIINQIPGVDNQDNQISIRGSSGYAYGVGSRVMVALDGLPLLSGDAGSAKMDLVPVDQISRIEVLKGASSVLYGSGALGGVINFISSMPEATPRTRIRLRGALYDQPRLSTLDWDGDAQPYEASAHLSHTRKWKDVGISLQTDFIKNSGYRQATDREEFRGLLRTQWQPSSVKGLTLGLNVSTRLDSSGSTLYWRNYLPDTLRQGGTVTYTGGGLTPTEDPGGVRRQWQSLVALDPSAKYLSPNGNLFWYRGRWLRNTNRNDTDQSSQNGIFYNDGLYQTRLWEKVTWVTGLSYIYATANGDSLFGGAANINGEQIFSDGRHRSHNWAVYSQLDGTFGKWNLSLGFRLETIKIDSLERETQPILRAGVNYAAWPGANFRGSVGQAFRTPTVAERFTNTTGGGLIIKPNPVIRSETGYSWELGLRQGYRAGQGNRRSQGYLDLAVFQMRFNNMIEFGLDTLKFNVSPSGQILTDIEFTTINVADARITGLELTTVNQGVWDKWTYGLSGGLTLLDPIDLNAVAPERQLDLSRYPENILKLITDIANPNIVDQPEFLKYRSKALVRGRASIGYGKWEGAGILQYRSLIKNIDQYLFAVVDGLNTFREKYPNGHDIWDFILSFAPNDQHQFSFVLNNAFNEEYLIIPGTLGPQRKFSIQYLFEF